MKRSRLIKITVITKAIARSAKQKPVEAVKTTGFNIEKHREHSK